MTWYSQPHSLTSSYESNFTIIHSSCSFYFCDSCLCDWLFWDILSTVKYVKHLINDQDLDLGDNK